MIIHPSKLKAKSFGKNSLKLIDLLYQYEIAKWYYLEKQQIKYKNCGMRKINFENNIYEGTKNVLFYQESSDFATLPELALGCYWLSYDRGVAAAPLKWPLRCSQTYRRPKMLWKSTILKAPKNSGWERRWNFSWPGVSTLRSLALPD